MYCGLLANVPVIQQRFAYLTAAGVSAANSNTPLKRQWFESVAETTEQVDDLSYKTNADRATVEMKAKHGNR